MILAVYVFACLHLSASLKGSLEKYGNVFYALCWLVCLSISVSRNLAFIVYALPVHMSDQVVPKMAILHERCALFGSLEGSHFGSHFGAIWEAFWSNFWSHLRMYFAAILVVIEDRFRSYFFVDQLGFKNTLKTYQKMSDSLSWALVAASGCF